MNYLFWLCNCWLLEWGLTSCSVCCVRVTWHFKHTGYRFCCIFNLFTPLPFPFLLTIPLCPMSPTTSFRWRSRGWDSNSPCCCWDVRRMIHMWEVSMQPGRFFSPFVLFFLFTFSTWFSYFRCVKIICSAKRSVCCWTALVFRLFSSENSCKA